MGLVTASKNSGTDAKNNVFQDMHRLGLGAVDKHSLLLRLHATGEGCTQWFLILLMMYCSASKVIVATSPHTEVVPLNPAFFKLDLLDRFPQGVPDIRKYLC